MLIARLALLCVASVALFGSACLCDDGRVQNHGPEVTADLIVYFKTDTTQEQIKAFWDNVVSDPTPEGRQFLRPGIGRLSRVESVEGHEGIAIVFQCGTADNERAQLRQRINGSPIVFTVLENTPPINVKSLKAA